MGYLKEGECQGCRALRQKYGISGSQRKLMADAQEGKCAICLQVPDKRQKKGFLVIDHDHNTGKVRGLLCRSCNIGIGFLLHDEKILYSAIAYLRQSQTDWLPEI
jgi:hypothetical protein